MNTLLTIIHGLAIGILVSAPMGPIGMLCIQRTLNKGRRSGLYTGIGAALSDFIYALLAGLGMSIIIDFVEDNEAQLQLIGSIVLLGFGIYIARKNPAKVLKARRRSKQKKDSMLLIDGGLLNNYPVDIARQMGADIVIGVDLSEGKKDAKGIKSMMDIMNHQL